MLGFKLILDIKKLIEELYKSYKFLRKNKIISPTTLFLFFLTISLSFLVYKHTILTNSIYDNVKKQKQIREEIIDSLKKCNDKIAISIIVVSISPNDDLNSFSGEKYPALFEHAMAWDCNIKDCLVDLKQFGSQYQSLHYISLSFRNALSNLSTSDIPYFQDLRNKEEIPSELEKLLKMSRWYNEGQMNSIYIQAIINRANNLIYIITLTSAEGNPNCNYTSTITKIKHSLL